MSEIQEEEIDLREYINVLIKRKGIIILIFLIAVITAAIVSYFILSPIYQSSTVFGVAKIDGQAVINITESLEIIKSNIVLDEVIDRMGLKETVKQLSSQITTENLKGTNFIKVSVEHNTPENAKSLVENIIEVFIKQNQVEYQEQVRLIEDRLEVLEEQIVEFEKNILEIEKTKKKIAASEELSEAERQFQTSLLLSSSISERSLYYNLSDQVNSLKASLNNCEDFKIISNAQLPIVPIKPNKKLNILIAGVLGLFVGIFVAFFFEFWQKGK
ncbi:MAG: Wzz/FepE/Etk N-terminal domain-containing protein [Atribacterota bacterium]|nr:Wzz/FepE/Etk N-terminal domain-containing protein [Atribacterota bacterium]